MVLSLPHRTHVRVTQKHGLRPSPPNLKMAKYPYTNPKKIDRGRARSRMQSTESGYPCPICARGRPSLVRFRLDTANSHPSPRPAHMVGRHLTFLSSRRQIEFSSMLIRQPKGNQVKYMALKCWRVCDLSSLQLTRRK